jgi:hypothetical protein
VAVVTTIDRAPVAAAGAPVLYLGTNEPSWLWNRDMGDVRLFISRNRFARRSSFKPARSRWALDSGGFTELSQYGVWRTGPLEYAAFVARLQREVGGMDWAAPQDWMCEDEILARTGLSRSTHISLTVENFCDLQAAWPQVSDGPCPFIPVLQGWTGAEYLECEALYRECGIRLEDYPRVGLGSVCRRQATMSLLKLARYFDHLPLHLFGTKLQGIEMLTRLGIPFASSDTLAWSYDARRLGEPFLPSCTHKACNSCPDYALAWHARQLALLDGIRTTPIAA